MLKLLAIAVGGAAGSILRYAASTFAHRFAEPTFPWGTLAVNLFGCFLIGFLWPLFEKAAATPEARALVFIGILGGFTTFSTFGIETFHLLRDGEYGRAAANMLASNIIGIALVFAGFFAARQLIER